MLLLMCQMSTMSEESEVDGINHLKKARGPRSTPLQKEFLVEYMLLNKDFALGKFRGPLGYQRHRKQWADLMSQLNKIGPQKTEIQWKAIWKKTRSETRKANLERHRITIITGNCQNPLPIDDTSQKVLSIIGKQSSVGMQTDEAGFLGGRSSDQQTATLKDISQSLADIAVSLHGIKEVFKVFVKINRDKES